MLPECLCPEGKPSPSEVLDRYSQPDQKITNYENLVSGVLKLVVELLMRVWEKAFLVLIIVLVVNDCVNWESGVLVVNTCVN